MQQTALFSHQKFVKIVTEMGAGYGYTILSEDLDFVNEENSQITCSADSYIMFNLSKKKRERDV